jgi:hypothetical protein
MASLLSCTAPRGLLSSSQRLKDIQDALVGRPIISEMLPTQSQPPLSQAGREKRLRLIEQALSGSQVPPETTQMNGSSIRLLKRSASSTPDSPPPTKRRQMSPDWPDSSPPSSPTHTPTSSESFLDSFTTTTTPEPVDASPSPVPVAKPLPEKVHIYNHSMSRGTHCRDFLRFPVDFLSGLCCPRMLTPTSKNSSSGTPAFDLILRRQQRRSSIVCVTLITGAAMTSSDWMQ